MKRQGFTLTELVLVCAVISLLMAVLVPVLSTSRQKAKTVICTSNIRQLGIAVTAYSSSNGTVPHGFTSCDIEPPGGFPGSLDYNRKGWWWLNYIGQFYYKKTDQKNLLCCPAKNVKELRLKTNILCGNYGVNQSIFKSTSDFSNRAEFIGQPLNPVEISRPSETLLMVDSGFTLIDWWHAVESLSQKDASYVPGMKINTKRPIYEGQEHDAIGGRHPNRTVNVGFVDGHVENRKANELLIEKVQERYENRYPLWSPK